MKTPLRLLIHGASGRMGRALLRLAADDPRWRLVAAVSRSGAAIDAVPVFAGSQLQHCPDFDVAIDFSLPEGFDALLDLCRARGAALVCGTTGLSEAQRMALESAGSDIAVLWASNFSLGVTVLEDLVRRAAETLASWEVDITETHHVHKKDAPSGTALTLGRAVAASRGELPPIVSVREGEVIGEHTVRLSGPGERIELTHRAGDRDIFARGALTAALALVDRPAGSYRLADLVFRR